MITKSTYGKSNSKDSFLYDPLYTMKTTIAGQLFVSMWIERTCLAIPDCVIISSNTDGVCIKLKRKDIDLYESIIKQLTLETTLGFERTDYKKVVVVDVNNYLAEYEGGGIKHKGLFEIDKELHKDPSMRIVPIALENYFTKNIPIIDTIKNHPDILDFCLRLKVNKSCIANYKYIDGFDVKLKELGKHTRYYISNSGGALSKDFGNGRISGVNVGFVASLFNKYEKKEMKDYDINYNFYIKECKKIIDQIEDKQLSLFD